MPREPAVDHGGFNCPIIFVGAAASVPELRIDLACRRTPMVGSDHICQLKQFPLGDLGRGEWTIFQEFHFSTWALWTLSKGDISHD
jgi:hypothetical protein